MAEQMMQDAAGKATPAGYKQTEVGVIPEDWSFYRLGDLEPYITSGSRGWAKYYSKHGDVFVRITNMSRESIYLDLKDICYVMIDAASSEGKRTSLEEGDVLVSITADIGICSYIDSSLDKPAFINQHIALIRFNHAKINSKFIAYYLSSHQIQKLFKGSTDQGAKAGMNLDAVRMIKTALPTLQEQTAIANVLSDSDALIDALVKLIAKKQAIKTATMQQLLTGRTRLPQFALRPDGTPKGYKSSELGHIPEDWHEVSLSSVTKNIDAGVSVNSIDQLDAYGHGKHVLKTSCVNGGVFNCLEAKSIIPCDIGRAKCFPREGNIIVSRMNTPALVGEIGYIEKTLPGYFLPDRLWQVSFREDAELNTKWLMYVLAHPINAKKIKESATGTSNSMKNISKNAFLALNFYKPNIEEQTAIATILSDMDSELTALEQKLTKARDLKQGMMQQLLTGRIRLPLEVQA